MKLRELPSLACYGFALLSFVFAGGFWLQYMALTGTVDSMANALMLSTIAAVALVLGGGFDKLEALW